mmetsp:Transcript_14025/g.39751  ORF Transcript_14025/g.39751 Transcript_14025/m.39751 type:complete len:203 (-) Transcript_14025:69-677(-)
MSPWKSGPPWWQHLLSIAKQRFWYLNRAILRPFTSTRRPSSGPSRLSLMRRTWPVTVYCCLYCGGYKAASTRSRACTPVLKKSVFTPLPECPWLGDASSREKPSKCCRADLEKAEAEAEQAVSEFGEDKYSSSSSSELPMTEGRGNLGFGRLGDGVIQAAVAAGPGGGGSMGKNGSALRSSLPMTLSAAARSPSSLSSTRLR